VVLVFRDIAERKRAEDELQRSRDQLAVVLQGVADGITAIDRTGQVIYANGAAVRTLGFESQEELLATPNSEILKRFEMLDEEGNPFPAEKLPSRSALQGKEGQDVVIRWRRVSTGEESWSITKARPVLDEAG